MVSQLRQLTLRKSFEISLVIFMLILAMLSLQAWFSSPVWWLNLSCHFIPHYLALQFMILIALLILRGPELISRLVVLGLTAFPNLMLVMSYQNAEFQMKSELGLKLLHLNVYAPNTRFLDIAKMIRGYNPDVIDLVEYTESSRKGLEATGVFKDYPYRFTGKSHLGLYSRLPLSQSKLIYVAPGRVANNAQIHTRILLENSRKSEMLTLIVAHPQLPIGSNYVLQGKHFETWLQERESYGPHLMIVGDLNTTPWSPYFRKLVNKSDLRDSMKGHGIQASWPAWAPWLGIPIDHVLISSRLQVIKRIVGPDVGSDHFPVYVEVAFTEFS